MPSSTERATNGRHGSVLNRLASAHGHLGAVRAMAAEGRPCPEVVYQLRAVRGALAQVEQLLVRQHLHHCLADTSVGQDARLLDEIVGLWDYSPMRRGHRAGAGGARPGRGALPRDERTEP